MRRLIAISLALFFGLGLHAQQKPDALLDSLVLKYVTAIQPESVETKKGECDFLIGSVRDSLMRRQIALSLFKYYRNAPVMGDEAVAIYVFDKWFASGSMSFPGEFEKMDAEMFCNMNRNTLLGMDAPSLKARKPCAGRVEVPVKGKTTLMWFYDTACSKCRVEAKVLPSVLEQDVDFPLTLVAFYCGQSRREWREFRRSFKVDNPRVKLLHCWDPQVDSDYLRIYGVISTPKMYMVAPEGSIIGRRLEVESLRQLLPVVKEIQEMFGGNNK